MQSNRVSTGDAAAASQYDNLRDDAYAASVLRAHQQTTPGMTLYVENGAYYINGVRYLFAGGSSPTFTAPVSNPRIDVLSIDTTGTINITEGTEASSPAVPSYPENQVSICEVYHVVGETAIYTSNSSSYGWTSTQGYIQNDVRPSIAYGPNFAAVGEDIIPDAADTRNLGASGKQWNNIYGQNIYNNGALVAATKFGGTGADGALSISSGTTTINLGGASYFEKNYSSISITGTGQLTFSNPSANGCVVVLKCSGNCTITSTASPAILGDGLGAAAGNNGVGFTKGPTAPTSFGYNNYPGGTGFLSPSQSYIGINGKGVNLASGPYARLGVFSGAGGGTAPGAQNTGAGGSGGIGVLIEVAAYLDFTGAITSKGSAGANGSGSASWGGDFYSASGWGSNSDGGEGGQQHAPSSSSTCGGGGGGGGCVVILYNFLTANSGTITVTGGPGGTGSYSGAAGGNGFSYVGLNTAFS